MNLDTLIEAKRVGEEVIPVVDLRGLHKLLEVKRKFADWAKDRVKHYKEGEHYVVLPFRNENNGKVSVSKEYYVSLEIAKSVVKKSPDLVEFFEEKQQKLEPEKHPEEAPTGLISVKEGEIGGKKVQTVSANELYKTLGLGPANWARWSKQNIEDNPFAVEGEDYAQPISVGRSNDYTLSLSFAKILTMNTMTKEASEAKAKMIERDEKAMEIIKSFSKVEVDFSGSILSYKNGDLYITSLAIASLTGKEHFHVIRDIREETLKLQEEIDLSKSGLISGSVKEPLAYKEILRGVKESHYLDEQGRRYPCYELSESAAYQMMLKYSSKFRALIIYEFQQMRKNLMKMLQVGLIENAFPELAVEKQHVYVIRNTLTENLKIGVSKDPEKRLATLQTGSDAELTLEYKSIACSNALQIEAEVHKLLKDYHVRGEWFSASLEQVEACLSKVSYQLSLPSLEFI